MSSSISTLLTRNLHDVFGENDPARRRAAIDEIFTEDGVFYDPRRGVHRGRDEIDRVAGALFAAAEGAPCKPRFSPVFYLGDLKWARKQATRGRKISHCCAALRLSR